MDLFIGCEADDLEAKYPGAQLDSPSTLFYLKKSFSCHYAGIFHRANAAIRYEQAVESHDAAAQEPESASTPAAVA